jgi:putative ABC transport system permease protein
MASPPLFRIAARSVRKNARHSAGTVLAIAVGFVAVVIFDGYLAFLQQDQIESVGERMMLRDVVVERPDADAARSSGRPYEDSVLREQEEQAFLDAWLADHASEISARARCLYAWGSASTGRASAAFLSAGYDIADGTKLRGRFFWDALAGRPLQRDHENSVVLGRGLGALLDCEPEGSPPVYGKDGNPIAVERPFKCRSPRVQLVANTASGRLNAIDASIVGLVDGGLVEYDSKYVSMPLALAQRLVNTKAVSTYVIHLKDSSRRDAFAAALQRDANAKGVSLVAMPWSRHAYAEESRRVVKVLDVYRAIVATVVVLIAALSVLTTMAKAVNERTREIGTLRSLGFLQRYVVTLFALEAALLALVGTVVGAGLSLVVTFLVNRAGIVYDAGILSVPISAKVAVRPDTYLACAVFLAVLAAIAAVFPARHAAATPIPDALSHV